MSKRIGRLPFLLAALASTMSLIAAMPLSAADLVINEVDYDQAGTDDAEFVEIKNTTGGAIDLSLYRLILVNGSGPADYATFLPTGMLAAGDYYVICANAANTVNCDLDVTPETNLIQNGAPDAMRLELISDSSVVDALSYEGTVAGSAEGTGVATGDDNTSAFFGLTRFPDGSDTDDNNTDFSLRCITPGTANVAAATSCPDPAAPVLPNLSIDDVSTAEGDAGPTTFTFTVSIDAASASDVTFDYATMDGTATTADSDYTQITTTGGTITAGNLSTTIDVTVIGDTTVEPTEQFSVELSNSVGATLVDGSGEGEILDDDAGLVINEVDYDQLTDDDEFLEIKNLSAVPVDLSLYEVVLVNGSGGGAAVYATFNPTGTLAPNDYFVICANAANTPNCDLDVSPDTNLIQNGAPDALAIRLAGGGAIEDAVSYEGDVPGFTEGTGFAGAEPNADDFIGMSRFPDGADTSNNNTDISLRCITPGETNSAGTAACPVPVFPPNLSIDDVSMSEGDAGPTTFTFTVSIDVASASDVTFDYATLDGTATIADSDYVQITTTGGTITAGNLSTTIDVTVNGDTNAEGDEIFTVALSNVVGALLADGSGQGTILNDDAAIPNVTISDAAAAEGDGAGNDLTFDVTLDINASAEFSVTYTISDGTALVADSDYDNSGSGGTVTFAGGTAGTQQIVVPSIGDTAYESDETFSVVISNVSAGNAVITDDTGIGTIQNDDRAPIWAIQGNTAKSPFVPSLNLSGNVNGDIVDIAASVVTAIAYRADNNNQQAFFMQTPDADSDGDIATSDGIYVFSSTPVAVGDLVEVTGTVQEYYALTEIGSATVNIISSGNSLPTPVEFSAISGLPSTDPGALSCPGSGPDTLDPLNTDTNFECFEGMLVTVPDAVALNGNFRRTNDIYSEIQFSPRAERSLREAGLLFPQSTGAGNAAAPEWDGNPEIMEMDPDITRRGAGGPTPGIDTQIVGGASFSATGPLTFDFGDYVMWPTALVIDDASNLLPRPVEAPMAATELSIGSFNMQHLCDDNLADGCNRDSPRFPGVFGLTVWDYATKNARVAAYVCDVLLAPDVLGAQEVDSESTLADLATAIDADCGVSYSAALIDGNDPGGIDVGYLTRDDRVSVDSVTQFFLPDQWPDPGCSPAPCTDDLHDRPPLLLRGQFTGTPGAVPLEFAVLNNHTKARSQVDNSGPSAERDRAKRFWQARDIAELVQDFQTASGVFTGLGTDTVPLILVGDYNAFQFTDGRVDVVGLIAGTYNDDANECNAVLQDGSATVETCNIGTNIVSPALQNLVPSVAPGEEYSYLFFDDFGEVLGYGTSGADRDVVSGNVLDHILAAETALPYVSGISFGRANHDASLQSVDDGLAPDGMGGTHSSLALRSSDHDGLVAYFETNCANLAITPGSEPDPDEDGVCTFADNCPVVSNSDQTDANDNGLGAACDATPVAVNDPAVDSYSATEDTALAIAAAGLLANDTDGDGDSLSASLVDDSAANGSVTVNADGSFGYAPDLNFCDDANPVTFTYSASDGESTSSAATASILVACVNDAPVISDIASPQMTAEETTTNVVFIIADVDSALACSAANLTASSSNTTLMPVADIVFGGTLPLCTVTLTPATNQTGNSTIRITVSDGALEAFDEFVLSVSAVDDPAVLMDDTATVNEDAAATAIDVLANDSDVDNVLAINEVSQPANGTVVITGGGTGLTYQPDANYCYDGVSTDNFTYTVNAGPSANVSVTVTCVDDGAAQAAADSTVVTQNSIGNLIDVLANDTPDPDDASLTLQSVAAPTHGVASISGAQISYTPTAGFCGEDAFDYTLVGGNSATVSVAIDCLAGAIFDDGFEN